MGIITAAEPIDHIQKQSVSHEGLEIEQGIKSLEALPSSKDKATYTCPHSKYGHLYISSQ